MSLDDLRRHEREGHYRGQCTACGALPGHQRPAAVQPGIPPMPVQRPAYAVRLAADGASPPTMGPTDVFGIRLVVADPDAPTACPPGPHGPHLTQALSIDMPDGSTRMATVGCQGVRPGLVTRTSDGQTFHLVMIESPLRVGFDPGIGGEPDPSSMIVMRAEQDVRFVLRCDGCDDIVRPHLIAEHRCG